jgi:hypothetical protein
VPRATIETGTRDQREMDMDSPETVCACGCLIQVPTGRRRDNGGGVRAVSRWILLGLYRFAAQRIRLAKLLTT